MNVCFFTCNFESYRRLELSYAKESNKDIINTASESHSLSSSSLILCLA
jgi:hypothetical protein